MSPCSCLATPGCSPPTIKGITLLYGSQFPRLYTLAPRLYRAATGPDVQIVLLPVNMFWRSCLHTLQSGDLLYSFLRQIFRHTSPPLLLSRVIVAV